jgi:glycerate kinase
MSDGGDGFGVVLSALLDARARKQPTLDALHRPLRGTWWWQPKEKTAVIESANVIGLAMLPTKKFHPFQLDTFGLGKLLHAAAKAGARKCIVGIGGSSTNDGGFGLARSLGWQFFNRPGQEIMEWWQLGELAEARKPSTTLGLPVVVAVDVRNPLLGPKGCSRIYGPQKGLRPHDFAFAEASLGRFAATLKEQHGIDAAKIPGAGAAGGLGFGLMAFAGATVESGFDLFARYAHLEEHVRSADLVITGEGAMDEQTAMGKGVGQIARLCRQSKAPCIALAGHAEPSVRKGKLFAEVRALTDRASSGRAQAQAAILLEQLAADMAHDWNSLRSPSGSVT